MDLGSPIVDNVAQNDSDVEKSIDALESNNVSPSQLISPDYSISHVQQLRQKMVQF